MDATRNHAESITAAGNARIQVGNTYTTGPSTNNCLHDLRATDPRLDKTRIQNTKGGLIHDAYVWILENKDFQHWRDSDEYRLLWIRGDPGKGKTMLLCGIIDELKKSGGGMPVYFFCQATDDRINSATAVLRGLLFMLLDEQPHLLHHLKKRHETAGDRLFKDANAWFALCEVFKDVLLDSNLQPVYLIIDALDECGTDLADLLELISSNCAISPRIKWLVSSRNILEIEEQLQEVGEGAQLSLELNAESVSTAVESYIQAKVDHLSRLKQYDKYDPMLRNHVKNRLSEQSEGTFLWVAIVCQDLQKQRVSKTRGLLETFPRGLGDLYERMMLQVINQEDAEDVELCIQILAIMSTAYRPLTLDEMSTLEIPGGRSYLEEAVRICGSFLTIREDTVYFVHQSAKDHLAAKQASTIFPQGVFKVHHEIFLASLGAMNNVLRRDIYGLGHPGTLLSEIVIPNPDPLALVRYACLFWADHLVDSFPATGASGPKVQEALSIADGFLKQKLLFWLEALSLLESMSIAGHAMTKLTDLWASSMGQAMSSTDLNQKRPETSPFLHLIHDAYRFVLAFGSVISDAPLQTYASALIFSPTRSVTRNLFKSQEPRWVTATLGLPEIWDRCLATLPSDGRAVISLSLSNDDKFLMSGLDNGDVTVWDATTGALVRRLECPYDDVSYSSISLDCQRIATALFDGTVRVWSPARGCEIATFGPWGCNACPQMAFSPDCKALAVSTPDGVVASINLQTLKFNFELDVHDLNPDILAWSKDGSCIATGLQDGTTQIWDAGTGECLTRLKCHEGRVDGVMFIDDMRLLSKSRDGPLSISDMSSANVTRTFGGGAVQLMLGAYASIDGCTLASTSNGRSVELWNITTEERQLIIHDRHSLTHLALSKRLGRLFCAAYDGIINMWDISQDYPSPTANGQDSYSTGKISAAHIFISDDCQYYALGSRGKAEIRSITTSDILATLEDTGWILDFAFSSNGKHVACAFSAGFIHILNLWDGSHVKISSFPERGIKFSSTGHLLSSANKRSGKIWDVMSGELLCEFRLDIDFAEDLPAFSDDDDLIALIMTNTVQIRKLRGDLIHTISHFRSADCISFLRDSSYLATGSCQRRCIDIWNIETGHRIVHVHNPRPTRRFQFGAQKNVIYLQFGVFEIVPDGSDDFSSEEPTRCVLSSRSRGYGISPSLKWLTYNGKNLLWLPPDHRPHDWYPDGNTFAVKENRIVMVTASKRILVLDFQDDPTFTRGVLQSRTSESSPRTQQLFGRWFQNWQVLKRKT